MTYNPEIHHRRSIRLRDYDYSQAGAYFITICIQKRECLLGEIKNSVIELNQYGQIVTNFWNHLPNHFTTVEIDAATIMPNHFHGIIIIANPRSVIAPISTNTVSRIKNPHLGQIVAYFKYQTTKSINKIRNLPGVKVWQRNYYEHIIRNENYLNLLREYIIENPMKWEIDQLHPNNPSKW